MNVLDQDPMVRRVVNRIVQVIQLWKGKTSSDTLSKDTLYLQYLNWWNRFRKRGRKAESF